MIMSMGWMMLVAIIPDRPPLIKGFAASHAAGGFLSEDMAIDLHRATFVADVDYAKPAKSHVASREAQYIACTDISVAAVKRN